MGRLSLPLLRLGPGFYISANHQARPTTTTEDGILPALQTGEVPTQVLEHTKKKGVPVQMKIDN